MNLDELYAELDPWFSLANNPRQAEKEVRRTRIGADANTIGLVIRGVIDAVATAEVLRHVPQFPYLLDQRPDLYRGFVDKTWSNMSNGGVVSLIHPKTHFTEVGAAPLRREAYFRLRRNWHMTNKLGFFDIETAEKNFDIAIYGTKNDDVNFLFCASAHHPKTVADSMVHDGAGPVPSFRDDKHNWDLRPHRDRIQRVDHGVLEIWRSILENPDTPTTETRMVFTVNTEVARVLEKLALQSRIGELNLQFSTGWNETSDKKKGYFEIGWAHPGTWNDVILQGSHLGVSTPMIKQPNPTMKNGKDWSRVDLEALPLDFIPATRLQADREKRPSYDAGYTVWDKDGQKVSAREFYRVAWRQMLSTASVRALFPAIIPPGTAHINGVICMGGIINSDLVLGGAIMSSVLSDFVTRCVESHLWASVIVRLPYGEWENGGFRKQQLIRNYLRLNCLTEAYAPLWEELTGEPWTPEVPLRRDEERRQAQNEIDAIVAISLGITADELCMIYRTQFPVMRRYDEEDRFDANGRKVPKDIMKLESKLKNGEQLSEAQRTWTHPQSEVEYTYEYPFRQLEREADLRAAYTKFA